MTNPTPHGQVPEALIDLIDAYAETRHRCGGIYNARTEAARKAVIEALSGVQALSAGPGVTSEQRRLIGVIADKIEDGTLFESGIYPKKDLARFVRNMLDVTPTAPAASPTPPVEQQAASSAVLKAIHEANMQLVRTGDDAFMLVPYKVATVEQQAAPKAAPGDATDEALRQRDDAEDFIDALLDEVLGHERPEWSNLYGRADALNDVQERITSLHKPAVDKAWGQFQSAMAAPQQEAQEPAAFIHWPINGPPRLVWYSQKALNDAILKTHEDGYKPDVKLYTAPQPAPAVQGDAEVLSMSQDLFAKREADARDAARYRWLRDGNGYTPEECGITGGEELDELCDEGVATQAKQGGE